MTNKHHRLVNISSAVASYLINTDFFGKLSINIESENLEFRSKVTKATIKLEKTPQL